MSQPAKHETDPAEDIASAALQRALNAETPELQLRFLEIAKTVAERRKAIAETQKSELDVKNVSLDVRFQKTRFWATTFTPVLAVVITAITLVATVAVQTWQFRKTAESQRAASEDSQWRDALGKVSFADSNAALGASFAMQGFFGSKRYGPQARSIATALLPLIGNVEAFDEILTDMTARTKETNEQTALISIAQMISFSQREQYHIVGAASKGPNEIYPFLNYDIVSVDTNPKHNQNDAETRTKIAAWKLDTVSHFLSVLWNDKTRTLTPTKRNLTAVVLEDANFDALDFSDSNLRLAVAYRASFKNSVFRRASLTDTLLREVQLDGADLSEVKDFKDSKWEGGTNWWKAKCLSPELLDYLSTHAPHVLGADQKRSLTSCR